MQPIQWAVVIGVSLAAALFDVGSRRIPNLLTAPALLAGIAWSTWCGGLAGLADSIAAALLLALPYVLLFLFASGGAGDAKLMASVGAWLGMINGMVALAAVCVSGVILAVAYALIKKQVRGVLANLAVILHQAVLALLGGLKLRDVAKTAPKPHQMQKVPYGVAIFAGVCIAAAGVLIWRG